MPRYDLVKERRINKTKMSTNIVNVGSIDAKELTKDNSSVLTLTDVATNKDDYDNKIISLGVLNRILNDYNSSNSSLKNPSLFSDIKVLEKENCEIQTKINVLLDKIITPELSNHLVRQEIITSLEKYNDSFNNLKDTMLSLIEKNEITESDYKIFNTLSDKYISEFENINKVIQVATQVIMNVQSDNILKITNDKIDSQLMYRLEIHSTNGPLFRKGYIDTELYVCVYKSKDEVTDTFTDLQFRWSRRSSDVNNDELWSSNVKRGKRLNIENSDYVVGGCSFICTLYDEDGRIIASS